MMSEMANAIGVPKYKIFCYSTCDYLKKVFWNSIVNYIRAVVL